MEYTRFILVIEGILLLLMSLLVMALGIKGLTKKRPLIFSSRWIMTIMIAGFLPALLQSFSFISIPWEEMSLFSIIMPAIMGLMFIIIVFMAWKQLNGYMIFGISDETFHNALIYALNKLNLTFQETVSKIKLVELNADLQAAVTEPMGTAQIRIKQSQHAHHVKEIVAVMNEYYDTNPVKLNPLPFIIYLILGILLLVTLVAMGTFMGSFLFR